MRGAMASGVRLFDPLPIRLFTSPQSPVDQPILRGLGWDIDSPFSSNRGELFPIGSYGHTGFTGTGLWIDFDRGIAWSLLTNRVHPTRHFDSGIVRLRQDVGGLVIAGLAN